MCGRFNVIDNPDLQTLLRELGIDLGLPTRANIAPTDTITMVRASEPGGPELAQVRWWLTPHWARQADQKYSMFNARSENLEKSRAFSEPFKRRRGIVPISSFIEWRTEAGKRQPYLIEAEQGALALAAVWDSWRGGEQPLESCALVTTAAAPEFEQVHKRMPVMLPQSEWERWLDPGQELSANDVVFAPVLSQPLRIFPISPGVNNARNKEPELLEQTGEAVVLPVGE